MSSPAVESFHTVMLGAGPAGTGPLVQAAQSGELDELLDRGVALVDQGQTLCDGAMANYRVLSNTYGGSFLECLDGPHSERVFAGIRESPPARAIERRRGGLIPLELTGPYLRELGGALARQFPDHPASRLLTRHRACSIEIGADGSLVTRVQPLDERGEPTGERRLRSRSVVFALGGHQRAADEFGDALGRLAEDRGGKAPRVLTTETVLGRSGPSAIARALDGVREPRVAIVGGSHSAFCSAWVLLERVPGVSFGDGAIRVMHTNRIKLFYPSREEARRAVYSDWDEGDVCPLTQRVFRLGGIRGDAHALCRRATGAPGAEPEPRVRVTSYEGRGDVRAELLEACLDADLVLPAFGYRPRLVPVAEAGGRIVELRGQGPEPLVDERCRVLHAAGEPVGGLSAIGLGTGFRPTGALGGEPSFDGQTNGLWLYQNGIGRRILDAIA